jgi:RNA recognition motif-containing protein
VEKARSEFQDSWKSIEFEVSEVYMISRSGFDDPFEIRYVIPFGGKTPVSKSQPKKDTTPKPKLFVSNLAFSTTGTSLAEFFKKYAVVVSYKLQFLSRFQSARIALKPGSTQSKGFGFVELGSMDEATAAVTDLNGKELDGRIVSVQISIK